MLLKCVLGAPEALLVHAHSAYIRESCHLRLVVSERKYDVRGPIVQPCMYFQKMFATYLTEQRMNMVFFYFYLATLQIFYTPI